MYVNSKVYKIYSVVVLILTVIVMLFSLINGFSSSSIIESVFPGISGFMTIIKIVLVLSALLSVFFCYVEFSSMYAFGDMIEYVQGNSPYPMVKKAFVASPSFYRGFGSVVFIIVFLAELICSLIMIIAASVSTHYFISLPVLPLIGIIISLILAYITYYVKYKAIGDLLEVSISNETGSALKESLSENKPRVLRAFCTILFVVSIISVIAVVIALIFAFQPIAALFGTAFAIGFVIGSVIIEIILLISLAVTGCYFDNLGKMLEHYLIKYKLI